MNYKLLARHDARLLDRFARISLRTPARPDSRMLIRYQVLVMAGALGAIYANLPIYLYVLDSSLLPKYIFFGVFAFIIPLMIIKYRALGDYLVSPFAMWAILFLVLNMIHLANYPPSADLGGAEFADMQMEARRSMVTTRAQYVLFALFLGFVAYVSGTRRYLKIMIALMVVVPCAVILDFTSPGLFYPPDLNDAVLGRAAAMFINPNMAGEAILHIFLLGCLMVGRRYRVPLLLLAGLAILTTFSRACIIAWLVVLVILVYQRTLPKIAVASLILALGILLVSIGSFESYLNSRDELEAASGNILSRLNFFSSFTFDDDSSEERAGVIRAAWELFLQNPFFGAGAGVTNFWSHRGSTHNQLLLLAAEYGLLGIFLWGWMLIMLCKSTFLADRGLQYATAFLFAFMSFFTHQMLDGCSYWLATFAMLCSAQGGAPVRLFRQPIPGRAEP